MRKTQWFAMVLALAVSASFAPQAAAAQAAGVKGESSFEVLVPFTSGGSEVDFTLRYRATPSWALGIGLAAFSGGGITGRAFGVGAAYYPATASPTVEPYLFGEFVSLSASSGTASGSASGIVLGVGASRKTNEQVTFRGSLGWASIGGASELVYTAGLDYAFARNEYVTLGVTGGGGSSAFFAGLGFKF